MKKVFIYALFISTIINQNILIERVYANAQDTVYGSVIEGDKSMASTVTSESIGAASSANAAAGGESQFKKYFDSPMGTIIISGIATVYSGILYKAAGQQEKESTENIKKIDKMIASFKDSYSGYCPKGRDDLAVPSCYCYTDAGKQNTARTNSQACIALWAKDKYSLGADAANYANATYNADVAGCVTVDGQFDETCKCKKYLDSAGKNACKKETSVTLSTNAITTGYATGSGLADLLKYSSNATNGNPGFNLINAGTLATKAVNSRAMANEILSKLPLKANEKPPVINESNVGKFARAVLGDKNMQKAAAAGSSSAMNVASSRSDNPAIESLLQQAQAKIGIDISGSGKGLSAKDKKKAGSGFTFGGDSGGSSSGQVMPDFPATDKNYKYKNSDIVTDNSASIFEIISNRYVQSGLKRLFDDEAAAVKAP